MADEVRSLSHDPAGLAQALRTFFDTPIASCRVTAGVEAADKRRVTVQVVDRLKKDWAGRWLVEFFITATANGVPSATGNTYALITGTAYQTVTANAAYRVITDANGTVVFDLTIAGAATRYVATLVDGGKFKYSDPLSWAA